MGRAKQMQIEMEEKWSSGYLTPDAGEKYVCASHFDNHYLRRYISNHGHNGTCSYCGKKHIVIDLSDFIEYVGDHITSYLGPVDNEDMYLANSFLDKEDQEEGIPGWETMGCYIVPSGVERYEDVEEVMDDYDLNTDNKVLNDDIAVCFNVNLWIRKDPTSALLKDELMQSWKNFSHLVRTKQRYTFFRGQEYYEGSGFVQGLDTDIIVEVTDLVRLLEDTIPVGTLLYRGRPEDKQAPFTTFESMTAPPVEAAKENRMSPYGISMYYGSLDRATPLAEIRNYLDDKTKKIYIGEFEVTRPLKVINLCNIPTPDFWMENKDDWQRYAFLINFHKEISKPVGENDPKIEYIPSQVFCEYLRYIQKSNDGGQYDGIIYKSALTGEQNVALFYDNKTSAKILNMKDLIQQ